MVEKYQNVAVSAFISHEGKVLVAQRAADEDFLPNNWEQVGGKVEWGENPFDGLVREVKEEGILQEITGYKRNRLFEFIEYVKLFEK